MNEFQHDYNLEKLQTITPQKRGFKMQVPPRYLHHFVENIYEEFSSDLLLNLSPKTSLFIDIGAHCGFYTLLIGTKCKDIKIIAFEPVPENYEILKRNVQLNKLGNIELFNLAVSNQEEIKTLNVAEASDSCGFYPHPLTKTLKTIEVKTVPLDNFLKDAPKGPILIKIDTEGHELQALEGMENTLKNIGDISLLIEFNPKLLRGAGCPPEDLLHRVDQLGFDIYCINDEQREIYRLEEHSFKNWSGYFGEGNFKKDYFNIFCTKKNKSLSVLFFSHSSQLMGAERSLLELITELIRDHGVICSVVLPNDGPLKEKLEQAGAATVIADYSWWCDSNSPSDREIRDRLANSFKIVLEKLKHKLENINPDVVFTNTIVIPWGSIAASFLGKPHVWFIREFGHDFKFFRHFQIILNFIRESSNLVLVNSNAVRNTLFRHISDDNIQTIYTHIDIPSAALSYRNQGIHFKRTNATKLIITGTISENKGQEDAVLAVKELIQRKKDVELIIIGPAVLSYLKALKELVRYENLERYIKFFGFEENAYPVVNYADIVLVCSRNESFGRTTLEAMLLKKPVIGTNAGGTPELIQEGFNGLLYEPGDYKQLADRIEYLIENKEKIKEFGENGHKFAHDKFTKENYGGKIYKFLEILKNKGNPLPSLLPQFIINCTIDTLINAETAIKDKTTHIENLERQRKEKDTHIRNLERQREENYRDWQAHEKSLKTTIEDKEAHVRNLNQVLLDKEEHIKNVELILRERQTHIENLERQREENYRDWQAHTKSLEKILEDRGQHVQNLEAVIREKDSHIGNLGIAIRDKDTYMGNLQAQVKDKDVHIGNLETIVRDKDEHISNLEASQRNMGAKIGNLEETLKRNQGTLNYIYNSYGLGAFLVCNKMIDKIFPLNSKRRLFAKTILKSIKNPKNTVNHFNRSSQ